MQANALDCELFRLTENACTKIHQILASDEARDLFSNSDFDVEKAFVRFSVIPGGCKGMQYDFSLDARIDDGDLLLENNGRIIIVVDDVSIGLVRGAMLDHVESLGSSSFKIINPNVSTGGGCGCGKSFTA